MIAKNNKKINMQGLSEKSCVFNKSENNIEKKIY